MTAKNCWFPDIWEEKKNQAIKEPPVSIIWSKSESKNRWFWSLQTLIDCRVSQKNRQVSGWLIDLFHKFENRGYISELGIWKFENLVYIYSNLHFFLIFENRNQQP